MIVLIKQLCLFWREEFHKNEEYKKGNYFYESSFLSQAPNILN